MVNQNTSPNALIILAVAFLVWFMTQTFKLLVVLVNERRLALKVYGATGGMPSTHAAVCSAFAMGNGMLFGFTSPHFTMAVMFLVAVVHDAVKVRTAIADNTKTMKNFLANIIENEYSRKILELNDLEKKLNGYSDAKTAGALRKIKRTRREITDLQRLEVVLGHTLFESFVGLVSGSLIAFVGYHYFYPGVY
ncbi:MAG: divergent PAP2 family protein [Elusimicrobiota bacterium]|nr:divergent PAP2 family protein [Elusimicrobiota bacterium]